VAHHPFHNIRGKHGEHGFLPCPYVVEEEEVEDVHVDTVPVQRLVEHVLEGGKHFVPVAHQGEGVVVSPGLGYSIEAWVGLLLTFDWGSWRVASAEFEALWLSLPEPFTATPIPNIGGGRVVCLGEVVQQVVVQLGFCQLFTFNFGQNLAIVLLLCGRTGLVGWCLG